MEANKARLNMLFEQVINNRRLNLLDELVAPDYVGHSYSTEAGPAGLKGTLETFITGFPDMRANVLHMIAEGDSVVAVGYMSGTHTGTFFGVEPTGKYGEYRVQITIKFHEGKAIEGWMAIDLAGILKNIGLLGISHM